MAKRWLLLTVALAVGLGVTLVHPLTIWLYLGGVPAGDPYFATFWLLDVGLGLGLAAANAALGFELGRRGLPAVPGLLWLCGVPVVAALFSEPIVAILALYLFLAGRAGHALGTLAKS